MGLTPKFATCEKTGILLKNRAGNEAATSPGPSHNAKGPRNG